MFRKHNSESAIFIYDVGGGLGQVPYSAGGIIQSTSEEVARACRGRGTYSITVTPVHKGLLKDTVDFSQYEFDSNGRDDSFNDFATKK